MVEDSRSEVSRIFSLMQRLADKVTVIEYPEDRTRSVDLVVEPRSGEHAIIKVSKNVSNRKKDFMELKRITEFLDINALVITERYNREKLLENVLYIRGRIGIISPETLESLCRDESIYIYEYQGSYYVKIKGDALKRLRSKYRLGYSMLAKMLGITSKTLYEYEQGRMGMSIEVAERFLNLFGDDFEEALESIDVFKFRILSKKDKGEGLKTYRGGKGGIAKKIEELGLGDVEVFNHIPSDLVIKARFSKMFVAIVSGSSLALEKAAKKCRENTKLAHELGGQSITFIGSDADRDVRYIVEECSDAIGRSPEDLAEIVYREERK